tara:strand:+ start:209 stop:874 length:666 start_codon:yes stop_codon:yes gene_type:complete
MKKLLLLIGITAVLFSCTTPMEKKYNEKTALKDIQLIKEAIDSTEFNLLAGSVFRLKFEDKKLEEMTYAEILEEGKKWRAEQEKIEAEQKALAEKAAKDEAERIKKLTESVIVSCFEKGYSEVDYQDYITYKFVILNKSDKAIRAVKGGITFTNLFDEKIKSLSFVYDKPIEAGEQVNWDATTEYNQFMSEDKTLKNKDLKDLKVVWNPEKILFEDGTTLE